MWAQTLLVTLQLQQQSSWNPQCCVKDMKGSRVNTKCLAPGIQCRGFFWHPGGPNGGREIFPGEFWITGTCWCISVAGHEWNISGTTPLHTAAAVLLCCEAGVHKHGEHIWAFWRFDSVYWAAACFYFPKLSLKYGVKPLKLKKE